MSQEININVEENINTINITVDEGTDDINLGVDEVIHDINLELIPLGEKGIQGDEGLSSYEVWLSEGNTGTKSDYLLDIKGAKGDKGEQGIQGVQGIQGEEGLSAYEVWLAQGNTGTEADYLLSIKGDKGEKGDKGLIGDSAYELWLAEGNVGTKSEYIASLKGEPFEYNDFTQAQKDEVFNTFLSNFYNPSVVALHERGTNESAFFDVKLWKVQRAIQDSTASLEMIPSVYKAGKLYSVIPEDGSGDFTVNRNSTATIVNSDGLIEDVPINTPRIDYSTGEPSLLVEKEATNLIEYSNDFSKWNNTSSGTGLLANITPNYTNSPNGKPEASRVQFDLGIGTASNDLSMIYAATIGGDNYYANSIWLKSNTLFNQYLVAYNTKNQTGQEFLVTTKWERFTLAKSTYNGSNYSRGVDPNFIIGLRGDGTKYWNRTNAAQTADILMWNGQIEKGYKATSDILTNGGTVTRLFDRVDGAKIPTSDEGVIYFEIPNKRSINPTTSTSIISLYDDINKNRIDCGVSTDMYERVSFYGFMGVEATGITISTPKKTTNAVNLKFAFRFKENHIEIFVNGISEGVSNTNTSVPFFDKIRLTNKYGHKFCVAVKDIKVYPTALTDQQLIDLTTL